MDHGHISEDLARRIGLLRERIEATKIPASQLDESMNFATWNIRDFGKKARSDDAIHLIAEIIYQFDLVALVELRDDLSDLKRVMQILGPYWKVVFSDFGSDRAANSERVAYLFDKRMVSFSGLAAEASPPRARPERDIDYQQLFTWWRAPYMASFRAGSFDFVVLSAHMRWGRKLSERRDALENLGKWIKERVHDDAVLDRDWIVAGDFNIPKIGDRYFKALSQDFLRMPAALGGVRYTNVAGALGPKSRQHNYDQILHVPRVGERTLGKAGILDFATGGLMKKLLPGVAAKDRTYQLSDHLPLWIQIDTDLDDWRLDHPDAALQQII